MKALIKLRIYDCVGGGLLDEKTVKKEFETAMPFCELVHSVLEEFQLQQMTVQSLKLFDNASNQLVDTRAVKLVRDMGEYEVSLVAGSDGSISSGPSASGSKLSASGPQDRPSGSQSASGPQGCGSSFQHITCKVDDKMHKITLYEGARVNCQAPAIRLEDTVAQLKRVIGKLEGARDDEVQVIFQCGRLHDNRTLRESGIKAGAELDVRMPLCSKNMNLFVKNTMGQTICVRIMTRNGPYAFPGVSLTDTIGRLKEDLYFVDGVRPEYQRITFGGRILENDKTLADYELQNESTIHMVLRLRGC
ncbi:Polyubiqutin 4 [Aphelenchoides avenae]|nr:Polyubiqutin 4 [Aphelenchus avenae]